MTIVSDKRAPLEDALALDQATLLLVAADPESADAQAIHDKAESIAKEWQTILWIQDLGLLKPAERKLWFELPGHYAVVGGTEKVVALRGELSELMTAGGRPSSLELRWALAKGDKLP